MPQSNQLYVNIGQGFSMLVGLPTIGFWDNSSRPQNAKVGTIGYNTDTNRLEYWDGTDWYVANMNTASA